MKQILSINHQTIGNQLREWHNKLQFMLDESRYFKNKLDRYSSVARENNVQKAVMMLREQLFHFISAVEQCLSRISDGLHDNRRYLSEESGCVEELIMYFESIKLQVKPFLVRAAGS